MNSDLRRVSHDWNSAMTRANHQLRRVYIQQDRDTNMKHCYRAITSQQFPQLKTLVLRNLGMSDLKWLFQEPVSVPSSVQIFDITVSESVNVGQYYILPGFIGRNRHVKEFKLCDNMDNFAHTLSEQLLSEEFPVTDPLLAAVTVGKFATLQPYCFQEHQQSPYRLRWVYQCPFENCLQRFCWTQATWAWACTTCAKQKSVFLNCDCFPYCIVCPAHAARYLLFKNGRWTCKNEC